MNEDRPFIVVKFLPTPKDDNIYYEVALAKWLVQIDKNMMGKLLWPDNDSVAGKLVRIEAKADKTWRQLKVEVKRYYETYTAARNATKGFEEFASAYESDSGCQMGRGMRRKRLINPFSSSDSSDSDSTKKSKQSKLRSKVPKAPPPPLFPPGPSYMTKSLNIASKENIAPLTVVSKKKQGKTATVFSAPTTAINQHTLLHKIVNLRQQAANKAQQRKEAMSLENIHKLKKKTIDSTLCSEVQGKTFEAGGSDKSEPQSPSILSPSYLHKHIEKSLHPPSQSSEILNDDQFLSQPVLDETQILCLSSPSTSDNTHQTSPRKFVAAKDKKNKDTDSESDELSQSSSQNTLTSRNTLISQNTLTSKLTTDTNLEKFLTKLDQKVDNIRAKLDMILINQSKMNRILLPEEKIISKPPNLPTLPLDTIEQVQIFEKFVSNDVHLSDTCYYLKSFPLGNDEARAMSKLMSNLMTNSLAQKFNFDGHGTKLSFKSTKLWELVQGTLLLKFAESDLSEALKSLRSWLRNAKGRK